MERRREPRIQAYQKVGLILLGSDSSAIDAHATQFSGSGLRLVLKQPVQVGTAVKVQGDDWLVLGEVCYCQKERLNFVAGLQLEHSLMGLRQLEELNRKFMSELASVEDLAALDVAE
jgi:PilZ domain